MQTSRWWCAVLVVGALALGGCASGATAQGMTIRAADVPTPTPQELTEAVTVEDISGGSETSPLWTSQVASDDFKEALLASLKSVRLLSPAPGRYRVRAKLLSLRQPLVGVDMTVTATVRWVVTDTQTRSVVVDDVIQVSHTAHLGDAVLGVKRLRLANEGAARKNIAAFIQKLDAAAPASAGAKGVTASR